MLLQIATMAGAAVLSLLFVVGICSGQDVRIFNGQTARPHAYPWAAHFVYSFDEGLTYGHYCGGSLISNRHVLTAAHCFLERDYLTFAVQFGDHNFAEVEGTEQTVGVERWIFPPNYGTTRDDIAIIVLSEEVQNTNEVSPINILRSPRYFQKLIETQKVCTLAGWGMTKLYTGWQLADVLQFLQIKLVDDDTCIESGNTIPTGSFCYEAARKECSGSCNGDSGSGIFTRRGGAYVLVGVHTHRKNNYDGCATGIKGAMDVSRYYEWIDSELSESEQA